MRSGKPTMIAAGVALAASLGCGQIFVGVFGDAPTTITLVNNDYDPIHFDVDGQKTVKVKAGKTKDVKGWAYGDCVEVWDATFSAHRSVDGEERNYGSVTCESNINDLKTVVFDGMSVGCGSGWEVLTDCEPETERAEVEVETGLLDFTTP